MQETHWSAAAVQGHMFRSRTGKLERHYNPQWLDPERIPSGSVDYGAIRVSTHFSTIAACV